MPDAEVDADEDERSSAGRRIRQGEMRSIGTCRAIAGAGSYSLHNRASACAATSRHVSTVRHSEPPHASHSGFTK
jgi:hypothetical protein